MYMEAPEVVFRHPTEQPHSLPSQSSPAVPRIKSCAMQDRFCDGAVASKYRLRDDHQLLKNHQAAGTSELKSNS